MWLFSFLFFSIIFSIKSVMATQLKNMIHLPGQFWPPLPQSSFFIFYSLNTHKHTLTLTNSSHTIYLLSMFIDFLSLFSPVEYKLVCFFSSFQNWFNLSNSSVLGTYWLFIKYILNDVSNIQFGNLARTFFDFAEADVG